MGMKDQRQDAGDTVATALAACTRAVVQLTPAGQMRVLAGLRAFVHTDSGVPNMRDGANSRDSANPIGSPNRISRTPPVPE